MCWIEVGAWSCTCRHFEGGSTGIFIFLICGGGGAWGSNKEEIRWGGSELQQGWNSVILFLPSNQNTETFLELCKFIGFNFPSKWYFEHFNLISAVELLFGPSSAF